MQILDLAGCIVGELRAMPAPADNNTATIDVSKLSAGVYFVKIENRVGKFVKR